MMKGYLELPKGSVNFAPPSEMKPLVPFVGYFHYGKCETEQTAVRIVGMQIEEKFPTWMAMSLRRLLWGLGEDSFLGRMGSFLGLTTSMNSYPGTIPYMTEYQKEEPGSGMSFYFSGLLYLKDYKVIEIKNIKGEDYIFPLQKFFTDLDRGLKFEAELRANGQIA